MTLNVEDAVKFFESVAPAEQRKRLKAALQAFKSRQPKMTAVHSASFTGVRLEYPLLGTVAVRLHRDGAITLEVGGLGLTEAGAKNLAKFMEQAHADVEKSLKEVAAEKAREGEA